MPIETFKNKQTEAVYCGRLPKKWQSFRKQAERRLQILDNATCLADLAGLPSNRLEVLLGDRKGQYSISINMKWRICFKWENDDAYDVEIVDYH